MARFRIEHEASTVSIELTDVGGRQEKMLEAFEECQAGRCTCPTDEYQKLASMEVEQAGDLVRLRLEAKPGERFDTNEIAACLNYTTSGVTEAKTES
jgi:hypothetical protein